METNAARSLGMLADVLGEPHTALDLAPHMTCSEADTVAQALALGGYVDAAARWLYGHANGDDDAGDRHSGLSEHEAHALALGMAADGR